MRKGCVVYLVMLFLIIGILLGSDFNTAQGSNSNAFELNPITSYSIASDVPSITWTSRTESEPQPLENNSIAAGDHVVVNATFPEDYNITNCTLRIWNGFNYTATDSLVTVQDPTSAYTDIINPDEFSWMIVKGIEKGLKINLTCTFTNNDSDFMVWPGSIPLSSFMFVNNIANMCTSSNPEQDSFYWDYDNDTMFIGCWNYENASTGTWTAHLNVGSDITVFSDEHAVVVDTYYISGRNQSYNILAKGLSDANETSIIYRENVSVCNFFTPEVHVNAPVERPSGSGTYNISWSCSDQNADDVNYFSVWVSNDVGYTFIMIAENLTSYSMIWDTTGWLEQDYAIRVRAYSVDFTNLELCSTEDPPTSYWPGDYGDGIFYPFTPTGIIPPYTLSVSSPGDISYQLGTTGHNVTLSLTFSNSIPTSLDYDIYDNDSVWYLGELHPLDYVNTLQLNVDGLSLGLHEISIVFHADSGDITRTFVVTIFEASTSTTTTTTSTTTTITTTGDNLVIPLVIGASIVSASLVIVIAYALYQKRT